LIYVETATDPITVTRKKDKSYHMAPDQFREEGYKLLEWIARYQEEIEKYPVLSKVKPGAVRAKLPDHPPEKGESFDAMLKDVDDIILPGITHWQSPNWFAFFPANASAPAILGDLLSSGLSVQGMLWATSPACTELETQVLDWLVELMDLPESFRSDSTGGGVIQDTASSSTLCALLAARERATDYRSNEEGCDGQLTAYTSSQAHSSVEKAIKIAGLGKKNLRMIAVDDSCAMRPDLLAEQISADRDAGKTPAFVCATVGTTSTLAFDPVREIGKICQQEKIWLHVDAAMAGTAALCPEFRHIHDGLELADSYTFNPHKWMFTNFDCNCFWVADRKALTDTLSIMPEYLKNIPTESGDVIDYRDWHIPLGRRFRALKLWFVIRHYGVAGLQYHVRKHVQLTQEFVSWIEEHSDFELAVPANLNLVCYRHKGGDELNEKLLNALNESGELYLTHTRLNGKFTLRFSIGQTFTERKHVQRAWEKIAHIASQL